MASFSSHVPLKFSIQSPLARFPYRIRTVCGHLEIRMLNLKTIGTMSAPLLELRSGLIVS
jgi:hypothetical protein